MCAIPQLVSAPLYPISKVKHVRRSHLQCEHSYWQGMWIGKQSKKKNLMCFGASLKNQCLKYLNEVQVSLIAREKLHPVYIRTKALIVNLVLEQSCKYLSIVRNSVIHADFLFNLALWSPTLFNVFTHICTNISDNSALKNWLYHTFPGSPFLQTFRLHLNEIWTLLHLKGIQLLLAKRGISQPQQVTRRNGKAS